MSEEFIEGETIRGYKTRISRKSPPGYEGHEGKFFAVHVRSKSDDCNLFSEVIHITDLLWLEAEKRIKEKYSNVENWKEFLEESIRFDLFKRAEERIDSKDYKKGKIYPPKKIDLKNFEHWLNEVRSMIDK